MATGSLRFGCMWEFNSDNENITAYLERFDLFVSINSIAEEQWASTVLLVLSFRHYSLIHGLVSSVSQKTRLVQVTDILKKHYGPELNVIAERFCFYQDSKVRQISFRLSGKSKKTSQLVQIWRFFSESLRDQLVYELNSLGHVSSCQEQPTFYPCLKSRENITTTCQDLWMLWPWKSQ